jgi:hypothetical protein
MPGTFSHLCQMSVKEEVGAIRRLSVRDRRAYSTLKEMEK